MSATVKVTLGEVESVYRCTYPLARAIEVILHHSDCAEEIEQEPCEDAISRQAAIYACKNGWNKGFDEIMEDIKQLPPVKPERKMGRWVVTDDDLVYCSECEDSYYSRPIDASWYYCPNCGARMDGEE